jgi:hypothetical protein
MITSGEVSVLLYVLAMVSAGFFGGVVMGWVLYYFDV